MQNAILSALVSVTLFASASMAQDPAGDLRRLDLRGGDPTLDAPRLGGESMYGNDRFPVRQDGRFQMPELQAPTTDLSRIGNGRVPEGVRTSADESAIPIAEGPERSGTWSLSAYLWQAPNTFSNPRYFEDVMLERHGHERFPVLQPLISGGRFFATFPMLPYLATVRPIDDIEYTLGFFRPGARAPALLQRPPYQRTAVLVEAAVVAGAIGVFP